MYNLNIVMCTMLGQKNINCYRCLSKNHFSPNLLWYSYPILQGFNYILRRWVPKDKYMQKVALRVFRIINVLINLTFNLQTSVLHLLFFSFKYLSHLDECPAETGGKSNTWRRLTLDGMFGFLLQVPRHRLRTTKETIKPNNKAPRRTLLFASFVMMVHAERP